jgi:hypothetical protein
MTHILFITLSDRLDQEFMGSGVEDGSSTKQVDIYTQRLAQLEKRTSAVSDEDKVQLTTKEYDDHIKKLSEDLTRLWANDERVGSLKIAIQMAKLLSDTTMPLYYPAIFVKVNLNVSYTVTTSQGVRSEVLHKCSGIAQHIK